MQMMMTMLSLMNWLDEELMSIVCINAGNVIWSENKTAVFSFTVNQICADVHQQDVFVSACPSQHLAIKKGTGAIKNLQTLKREIYLFSVITAGLLYYISWNTVIHFFKQFLLAFSVIIWEIAQWK